MECKNITQTQYLYFFMQLTNNAFKITVAAPQNFNSELLLIEANARICFSVVVCATSASLT